MSKVSSASIVPPDADLSEVKAAIERIRTELQAIHTAHDAGTLDVLTDNSGGTASNTLPAIGGTYVQADIRNSIASLAAKINALIVAGREPA